MCSMWRIAVTRYGIVAFFWWTKADCDLLWWISILNTSVETFSLPHLWRVFTKFFHVKFSINIYSTYHIDFLIFSTHIFTYEEDSYGTWILIILTFLLNQQPHIKLTFLYILIIHRKIYSAPFKIRNVQICIR